jgi:hypothetical protein
VSTSAFASGATAPNATDLAGAPASDYGAVMSGRVDALATVFDDVDFGSPSGTSTADSVFSSVDMVSPNIDLTARDIRFQLTAPPGTASVRSIGITFDGVSVGTAGCDIAGSATSCTISGPISVPAGSTLAIEDTALTAVAPADLLFAFRLTEQ